MQFGNQGMWSAIVQSHGKTDDSRVAAFNVWIVGVHTERWDVCWLLSCLQGDEGKSDLINLVLEPHQWVDALSRYVSCVSSLWQVLLGAQGKSVLSIAVRHSNRYFLTYCSLLGSQDK